MTVRRMLNLAIYLSLVVTRMDTPKLGTAGGLESIAAEWSDLVPGSQRKSNFGVYISSHNYLFSGSQSKFWTFSKLVLERRKRGTVVGSGYHDNNRVSNSD